MPGSAPGGKPVRFAYQVSTVAGDAIVRDKFTGLVWQLDVPANEYTWEETKRYCDGLSLAGFSDWRSPARIDMESSDFQGHGASNPREARMHDDSYR